jgi:uncharacterized membrane protein
MVVKEKVITINSDDEDATTNKTTTTTTTKTKTTSGSISQKLFHVVFLLVSLTSHGVVVRAVRHPSSRDFLAAAIVVVHRLVNRVDESFFSFESSLRQFFLLRLGWSNVATFYA